MGADWTVPELYEALTHAYLLHLLGTGVPPDGDPWHADPVWPAIRLRGQAVVSWILRTR